jgi:hypothetical protein
MSSGTRLTKIPAIVANLSEETTMRLNPAFAASLLAVMTALALNACATPDTLADAGPQQKMRPHSHLEEKTGIRQNAPVAMPDNPNAANDRTKHFHPRDGK